MFVDILEGPEEIRLVADMPGVKKDELHVEVEHDELHIRARDRERGFRLPPGVDATKVNAELKDGVLTLKLPKAPELKPRKIEIA
jgi:HSP20 family protein